MPHQVGLLIFSPTLYLSDLNLLLMEKGFTPLEILSAMFHTRVSQSKNDGRWHTGHTKDLRKRQRRFLSLTGFTPLEILKEMFYTYVLQSKNDGRWHTGHTKDLRKRQRCFLSLTGFTLIELVTVVVIIGILVSFGMPVYNRAVERARDNEAKTNLMLIRAAEKIYKAENGFNYPNAKFGDVDSVADINTNLRLNLNENQWDYRITTDLWVWFAWARRNAGGFDRTYSIYETVTDPDCIGSCP